MSTPRPYRKQGWEYNRCSYCGRFRPWGELALSFVPDTAFSSESESTRECRACRRKAAKRREADRKAKRLEAGR